MNNRQKRRYLPDFGRLPSYTDDPKYRRQLRAILAASIASGGGHSGFAAAVRRLKAAWDAKNRALPACPCAR